MFYHSQAGNRHFNFHGFWGILQRDSLQAIVTGSSGHVEHWLSQGPYLQANDQGELQFIPTETLAHRIGITEEE